MSDDIRKAMTPEMEARWVAAMAERRANPKPLGPPSPPWSHDRTVWLGAGVYPHMPGIAVLTVGGRLVSPDVVGLS